MGMTADDVAGPMICSYPMDCEYEFKRLNMEDNSYTAGFGHTVMMVNVKFNDVTSLDTELIFDDVILSVFVN